MSDDTINELQRALGRIEGKLDSIASFGPRIASLERWRAYTAGAGVASGMALGAAWHLFSTFVKMRNGG